MLLHHQLLLLRHGGLRGLGPGQVLPRGGLSRCGREGLAQSTAARARGAAGSKAGDSIGAEASGRRGRVPRGYSEKDLRLGQWAYLPHQEEDPPSQKDGCEAGCQQVLGGQPRVQAWGFLFRGQLRVPEFRPAQAQELGTKGLSRSAPPPAVEPLTLSHHPVQGWA